MITYSMSMNVQLCMRTGCTYDFALFRRQVELVASKCIIDCGIAETPLVDENHWTETSEPLFIRQVRLVSSHRRTVYEFEQYHRYAGYIAEDLRSIIPMDDVEGISVFVTATSNAITSSRQAR